MGYKEWEHHENKQRYVVDPRVNHGVSIQCLVHINQELVAQGEQICQCLQYGVHAHGGE